MDGADLNTSDEHYYELIKQMFEKEIRFNTFLGLQIKEMRFEFASVRLPFREELIGDPLRPALHGGVISSMLDTAGGLAAFTAVSPGDRVSTVDLRVDYLRPAALLEVIAEGRVVRMGNRVAVCALIAFQDDSARPVATGTGVYNVRRAEE